MTWPTGSSPGKNLAANASLTITTRSLPSRSVGSSLAWIAAGILVVIGVLEFALENHAEGGVRVRITLPFRRAEKGAGKAETSAR